MHKRDSLSQWASENDFDELCNAGCSPVSLALALWIIEVSQSVAEVWRTAISSARRRNQIIGSLEEAADALEEVQDSFGAAMLEHFTKSLSTDVRDSISIDPKSLNDDTTWPKSALVPHPTRGRLKSRKWKLRLGRSAEAIQSLFAQPL